MARKQTLINFHGNDVTKLKADQLVKGEIAVVHGLNNAVLVTKTSGDTLAYFLDSATTVELFSGVTGDVTGLSAATVAIQSAVTEHETRIAVLEGISADTRLDTLENVVGAGLSAYTTLCGAVDDLDKNKLNKIEVNGVAGTVSNEKEGDKHIVKASVVLSASNITYSGTTSIKDALDTHYAAIVKNGDNIEVMQGQLSGISGTVVGYVKTEIGKAVAGAFKYKGSKTVAEVLALTKEQASTGDIYNLTTSGSIPADRAIEGKVTPVKEGDNVACVVSADTVYWDKLASVIDLDNYYTKAEINAFSGAVVTELNRLSDSATSINSRLDTVEENISTVSGVVVTLNGTSAVTGSIKQQIVAAKNEVYASGVSYTDGKIAALDAEISGDSGNGIKVTVKEEDGKITSVVVSALTFAENADVASLSARVDTLEDNLEVLSGVVIDNELVTASALTDHNARIIVLETSAHNHTNKDILDGITQAKVNLWDDSLTSAVTYATGLDSAMKIRVSALEGLHVSGKTVAQEIQDGINGIALKSESGASHDVKVTVETVSGSVKSVAVEAPDFANLYDAKGAAAEAYSSACTYADGLNTAMDTRVKAVENSYVTGATVSNLSGLTVATFSANTLNFDFKNVVIDCGTFE